jgi:hypothetical protein
MRNPVFMAFHMDWLDPEDRAAIMRWRIRLAVLCGALVLVLAPMIAARTGGLEARRLIGVSSARAEPGGLTQCAWRDLQLVASIEAHGEARDVPAATLADAFFAITNARRVCAAGRIDEALAIYDGIFDALSETRNE